jgi:hypothetical protein
MTLAQINDYLNLLDIVARGGRVYLKQWALWGNPADGITVAFDRYPIPGGWLSLFEESAPVQTNFRQAAWSVPTGPHVESATVER